MQKQVEMFVNDMQQEQDCEICYKIICKRCGWIASDEAVSQIQRGEMTICPQCGWKPGEAV